MNYHYSNSFMQEQLQQLQQQLQHHQQQQQPTPLVSPHFGSQNSQYFPDPTHSNPSQFIPPPLIPTSFLTQQPLPTSFYPQFSPLYFQQPYLRPPPLPVLPILPPRTDVLQISKAPPSCQNNTLPKAIRKTRSFRLEESEKASVQKDAAQTAEEMDAMRKKERKKLRLDQFLKNKLRLDGRRDTLPEPNHKPRSDSWWLKPHLRQDMHLSLSPQEAEAISLLKMHPHKLGSKEDNKKKSNRDVRKTLDRPVRVPRQQIRTPSARGHLNDDTLFANRRDFSLPQSVANIHSRALFPELRNEQKLAPTFPKDRSEIGTIEKITGSVTASSAYEQDHPPSKRRRRSIRPPSPEPDMALAKGSYNEKDKEAIVRRPVSSSLSEKNNDSLESHESRVNVQTKTNKTGTPEFREPPTHPSKYKLVMAGSENPLSKQRNARVSADCFGNDRIMVFLASALCTTDSDGFMKAREAVQIRERVLADVYDERDNKQRAVGDDMGTFFRAARNSGVLAPPEELVQIWKERATRSDVMETEATIPCIVSENPTTSGVKENDQTEIPLAACGATVDANMNEEGSQLETESENVVPVNETQSALNLIDLESTEVFSESIETSVGGTDGVARDRRFIYQSGDDDDDTWSICFDDDQEVDETCSGQDEVEMDEEEEELKIFD